MTDAGALSASVHGPAATLEDALAVAERTKGLLEAVATEMGATGLKWEITSVQFKCDGDGCDVVRADRPGPDEGWSHAEGNDFCPECTWRNAR